MSASATPSLSTHPSFSTLRSNGPPVPPKPLHLTMSMRNKGSKGRSYPHMPKWGSEDDDDDDDFKTAKVDHYTALSQSLSIGSGRNRLLELFRDEVSSQQQPTQSQDKSLDISNLMVSKPMTSSVRRRSNISSGSTIKKRTVRAGKPIRTSIFFDAMLPNPLIDPHQSPTPAAPTEDKNAAQKQEDTSQQDNSNDKPEGNNVGEALEATDKAECLTPQALPQSDEVNIPELIAERDGKNVIGDKEENEGETYLDTEDEDKILDICDSKPAISLHPFKGEAGFGELTFDSNVKLVIEVEDVGGNWSLGFIESAGEGGRGLIPHGFYVFTTSSPKLETRTSIISFVDSQGEVQRNSAIIEPKDLDPADLTPELQSENFQPTVSAESEVLINVRAPELEELLGGEVRHSLSLSSESLEATPSMIRARSIGRNVVISGVEFVPTDLSADTIIDSIPNSTNTTRPTTQIDGIGKAVGLESFFGTIPNDNNEDGTNVASEPLDVPDEEDDSTEARERRWAAAVEHAERTASTRLSNHFNVWDQDPAALGFEMGDPNEEKDDSSNPVGLEIEELDSYENYYGEVDQMEAIQEEEENGCEKDFQKEVEDVVPGLPTLPMALSRAPSLKKPTLARAPSLLERISFGTIKADAKPVGKMEKWVLEGEIDQHTAELDSEREHTSFYIETGPAWMNVSPPFIVFVHSPMKRSSLGKKEYVSFCVSTLFGYEENEEPVVVERRYSHFVLLYNRLIERYPLLVVPILPEKGFIGRFDDAFVESRRRDLERWCCRIGRHPVLRSTDEVHEFLSVENEGDLRQLLASEDPSKFFDHVYHPAFNVDVSEAQEVGERFEKHTLAIEKGAGAQKIEQDIHRMRICLQDSSITYKNAAYNIARFLSGRILDPTSGNTSFSQQEESVLSEEEKARRRASALFLQTDGGALTWKEGSDESISMTKAVQAAAEAIGGVGELLDSHSRESLLPVQELLKEISYPHSQHFELLLSHKAAIEQHKKIVEEHGDEEQGEAIEQALSRLETILNITMAEIERAHAERNEDLRMMAERLIDSEIDFHEEALKKLRYAKSHFEPEAYIALARTGPRLRSQLEKLPSQHQPIPVPSDYSVPPNVLGLRSTLARPAASMLGTLGSFAGSSISNSQGNSTRRKGKSTAEIMVEHGTVGRDWEQRGSTWRTSMYGTRM